MTRNTLKRPARREPEPPPVVETEEHHELTQNEKGLFVIATVVDVLRAMVAHSAINSTERFAMLDRLDEAKEYLDEVPPEMTHEEVASVMAGDDPKE